MPTKTDIIDKLTEICIKHPKIHELRFKTVFITDYGKQYYHMPGLMVTGLPRKAVKEVLIEKFGPSPEYPWISKSGYIFEPKGNGDILGLVPYRSYFDSYRITRVYIRD
jgi:hypothetical protein